MRKLNVRVGSNGKIESLFSDDGGETWRTPDGETIRNCEIYDESPRFDMVAAGVFALLALLIAACLLVMWLGQ